MSDSRNVPSAPRAKRSAIAAVSSTGKPRAAFDVNAWIETISPASARRLSISWIMLSRIGPPPG